MPTSRVAEVFDWHKMRNAVESPLLVEQASAAVLVYRRGDSGFDREVYAGLDAIIPLPETECELALAELYQNVEFVPVVTDDEDDES